MTIDFEAEGLLEGTEGEVRDGRAKLLAELSEQGVSLEELRRAVDEQRLALLPVERELEGGGPRHTLDEVAELSGLDRDFLERQYRANGVSIPGRGEAVLTDADIGAAKRLAAMRASGMPDEQIHELGRVIGMTMSTLAAATRRSVVESFFEPGDNERDLGQRLAEVARGMTPLMAESLDYLYKLHLRDQIRSDFVGAGTLAGEAQSGSGEVSVGFADLVGFTKLGERIPPEELGAISGRLNELAAGVARPPVRLVKLLGDGAMLVSPDNDSLLEAALELVEAADADPDIPQLRAGVGRGVALPRAGDWYGRPVNLASRITDVARPGTLLCDQLARDSGGEGYAFSFAGEFRLKGVKERVKLFRCRQSADSTSAAARSPD